MTCSAAAEAAGCSGGLLEGDLRVAGGCCAGGSLLWRLVLRSCGSACFGVCGGGFLPLASVAVGITTVVAVGCGRECWISSVYISIR